MLLASTPSRRFPGLYVSAIRVRCAWLVSPLLASPKRHCVRVVCVRRAIFRVVYERRGVASALALPCPKFHTRNACVDISSVTRSSPPYVNPCHGERLKHDHRGCPPLDGGPFIDRGSARVPQSEPKFQMTKVRNVHVGGMHFRTCVLLGRSTAHGRYCEIYRYGLTCN